MYVSYIRYTRCMYRIFVTLNVCIVYSLHSMYVSYIRYTRCMYRIYVTLDVCIVYSLNSMYVSYIRYTRCMYRIFVTLDVCIVYSLHSMYIRKKRWWLLSEYVPCSKDKCAYPFERNVLIVTREYKHVWDNVRCKPYLYKFILVYNSNQMLELVGTGLSVLWVARATHNTLKPVSTLPR